MVIKTRCKNFNLLPLFEKNNGMVINKKNFCSQESRIALKTHQSPSLFSMADKRSIQGGKSVSIYLDTLFGKIILRSIKTRQRNGHKLCLFMHCNCYARQSATKNVFLQGHRQLQTAKGIPYRAIIKKKYILLSKAVQKFMTFVHRKTFSSRKRNAQYVGNSDKHNT